MWKLRLIAKKLDYAASLAEDVGEYAMWEDICSARDWATRLAENLETEAKP